MKDLKDYKPKINHCGRRTDTIVKVISQHSLRSPAKKEFNDINVQLDKTLRLSCHGLRTKDKTFHTNMKTDFVERFEETSFINRIPVIG